MVPRDQQRQKRNRKRKTGLLMNAASVRESNQRIGSSSFDAVISAFATLSHEEARCEQQSRKKRNCAAPKST